MIPAHSGDSGLFAREAYLDGSWGEWRLPLLIVTGLCGMALGFFTVRASLTQIKPQYRKTRALAVWMLANAIWSGRGLKEAEAD